MQLLIIAAALLSVLVQRSCCKEFGSPPRCLLNSLDVPPCKIVNTQTTRFPQNKVQPGRIQPIAATIPLDFQFSQEVVSVAEENGIVSVCMEMASDGKLFRDVEIRVVSQDGNATEPGDYTAVNTTVTFLVGTARGGQGSQICMDIIISDEDLVELDETFQLKAESLDPNVNILNTAAVIIINSDEPVFRFTQDLFTACERDGVALVNIELVSGTLELPIDIRVHVEGVFISILTFPPGSVPNTQQSFSIKSSRSNQIHVAVAIAIPVGVFQSDRTTIAHFTNASQPELYCTSFLQGSTNDNGVAIVGLDADFILRERLFTFAFVNSNGHVSFIRRFADSNVVPFPLLSLSKPPVFAPLWTDIDPSWGGLVLHRETQDPQLISRYASEVRNAFPDQPDFTPISLFIATWLQVVSANDIPGENTFQIIMATNDQASYVTFLYDDIQWTNSGRALAGINAGDGVRSVTLPESLSDDIRNLVTTSNVGVDGMWMYRVDSSDIISPGPR